MASLDFTPLLSKGLPPPAAKWTGFAKYNFIGGHNDPEQVPVDGLIAAAACVLKREGTTLSTYGLDSGPLGYHREGGRPPALYALSKLNGVIHIGSFSKSIAPALRVGYIVAGWNVLSHMLALKTDAGSGALEQMVLAEFCDKHFEAHVSALARALRGKCEVIMAALAEQFGTAAEFEAPKGGIFLWVKLPDHVDVSKLAPAALASGVAINPWPEWSTDKAYGKSRLRLCFAHPSEETIRHGIAALAQVCRREFGAPARIANVEQPTVAP